MASNTLIDLPPWVFQIRVAQFIIAFLVMIFTIVPIALWNGYYSFGLGIFTCIATMIIVGYWYYAYMRNVTAYNRWAILFLDCWAVLWWLISFATLAELAAAFGTLADLGYLPGYEPDGNFKTSRALTAVAAFLGAVEFILFIITLFAFATRLHARRLQETGVSVQINSSHLQTYPNAQAPNNNQMYPNNVSNNQEYPNKDGVYVSTQPAQQNFSNYA